MDIDLILTLDALLQDQNITHAAARLGISQPAMSARLARLRSHRYRHPHHPFPAAVAGLPFLAARTASGSPGHGPGTD
nr:LysR family transcriptional regulator [Enterobacter ludwigii]